MGRGVGSYLIAHGSNQGSHLPSPEVYFPHECWGLSPTKLGTKKNLTTLFLKIFQLNDWDYQAGVKTSCFSISYLPLIVWLRWNNMLPWSNPWCYSVYVVGCIWLFPFQWICTYCLSNKKKLVVFGCPSIWVCFQFWCLPSVSIVCIPFAIHVSTFQVLVSPICSPLVLSISSERNSQMKLVEGNVLKSLHFDMEMYFVSR